MSYERDERDGPVIVSAHTAHAVLEAAGWERLRCDDCATPVGWWNSHEMKFNGTAYCSQCSAKRWGA